MTASTPAFLSPAKINWCLRVVARRKDGFHEIESLVSPVTLYDELFFTPRDDSSFVLTCDTPEIPSGDGNLIIQVARRLAAFAHHDTGMTCHLVKRIPAGGGLGGGSSNAATTLVALNELWKLGLSNSQLATVAADVGSDVPLFLANGPVVITGRGEHVRQVLLPWCGYIVLLLPGMSVSTPAVYKAWTPGETAPSDSLLDRVDRQKPVCDASTWMAGAFNMLERPLQRVCPALENLRGRAEAVAERAVRVSGSGSSLFTAFDEETQAEDFARRARDLLNVDTRIARPITKGQGTIVGAKEVSCPEKLTQHR